ncbi:DUF3918 domain-containing protein [Alkalicoccobacillus porphyridii]|uniref:DUF3918 domain-containing protein n=1 Tax=Alkalicoccobacillus porphyridii TaxID=2597270 RepID=A0A553ZW12_9BACI|nr:DUF3918 domain-containing protein [Alkalicoccobacillus porphyridii]TSB45668.1 DUF3918 domain-containing protein [Alkalicoccobacillus porphyridii]
MRRAVKPLVMLGIGAAVYSMNQSKTSNKRMDLLNSIQKIDVDRLLSKKQWKKTIKRIKKSFR